MKKKITIIMILIFIVMFLIFIPKDKTEYKLMEITGSELISAFLDPEISITFALYNPKDTKAEVFLSDLEKVTKQAKENIYYVNTHFVTTEFEQIMETLISNQVDIQSYYVVQNGQLLLENTYSNFNTMYKDLNGKKYDTNIKKVSNEEKIEFINKSRKSYEEGNIAAAFNYLCDAWDLPEAKAEYRDKKYYKLIGSWEKYKLDADAVNTEYTSFLFLKYDSTLYTATKTGEIKGFEKPSLEEYTEYDIKVLEDKIYIKNKKNNKYEPIYDIISIGEYELTLQKGNKLLEFRYGY